MLCFNQLLLNKEVSLNVMERYEERIFVEKKIVNELNNFEPDMREIAEITQMSGL